jgi:ATP-dependent helicase/nuclease subunit A
MNDALILRDAANRQAAQDVTRSFLVQAPAGSGKTELLIQRFLALLAHVDRPERIVAMTFTRKAAGEMRERIIAALREAAAATPDAQAHKLQTREIANRALARDRLLGWNLLAHPAQLQVHTIDALCGAIARQAPVSTRLGRLPRFEEQSGPLYREAVRVALRDARSDDPAWQRVLAHLDNNASAAVELLAGMLAKRDQWLKHLVGRDSTALRAALEAALGAEIESRLVAPRALFPADLVPELCAMLEYASNHGVSSAKDPARASRMALIASRGDLPPATVNAVADWKLLADWMLTSKKAQWRKSLSANDGFPSKEAGADAQSRQTHKRRMLDLLHRCAATPGLADALDLARRLPPAAYADTSWSFVAAMLDLLPRLAAQLTVTFVEFGAIDFSQATLSALEGLGEPDAPSDLLLRLDFAIAHLLVDEFQDTSDAQYALIERLTAGWQPGDGRTLFAVGDPQQSIYRFREAEVRLFLDARRSGRIGNVPVTYIDLTLNFRSQASVVKWVNDVFPRVLAPSDDPWRSAVAYARAVPARAAVWGMVPTVEVFSSAEAEAAAVIAHVRAAQDAGAGSIAILVRARSHLDPLLPALRAARIEFAAVELESLRERQAILDLLALTHTLTQPADRLAWLACLRAPWCGLALPDLFTVANAADATDFIDAVASVRIALSTDGAERLARFAAVVMPAVQSRGRATLAVRVRAAWLALGGPACVGEPQDLAAAERFFALLAAHDYAGDIADYDAFVEALESLKAADDIPDARVRVMTLHKAKGLEFDAVILPGLARVPPGSHRDLLRWRMRPHGLLLAPSKARGAADDAVYDYLGMLAHDEADAELARLLYVGCTRAKTRLHLTAALDVARSKGGDAEWETPRAGSALAKLWPALRSPLPPPPDADVAAPQLRVMPPLLSRLPLDYGIPAPAAAVPLARDPVAREQSAREFDWAHATAAAVGTVAHRMLAQMGRDGLVAWNAERVVASRRSIERQLAHEGVPRAEAALAADAVGDVLVRLQKDRRGRWLFDPTHAEAASELALAGDDGGRLVHVTLDRTFVAEGVRWIVDFKTGPHEGGDVDAFLDREVERYREQLERYARIVRALDSRPIRLALYYPRVDDGWRAWDAPC